MIDWRGIDRMQAVEIENVTKTFGKTVAVNELTLAVPGGTVYGFIGPNGSGKSTTLRMIMNIYYPDRGKIRVFGEELHGAWTDRIGYLPEERGLYKKMKVRELLRFYGRLKNGRNIAREVDDWLERFELADWGEKKVETLSKGMSQKVQFISAVVARPEMVILDEPFSGLDPVNTEVLKDAVLELQSAGTTVIFSTHDMSTAEKMCDFIFMIYKGRKVLDGTLSDIQDQYGDDTIRVRITDDAGVLEQIPGVDRVNNYGRLQELRMNNGTDSQVILAAIMARTKVMHFEVTKPSLHDIFVRIARPAPEEVAHA
jgi:ABC-2 type transport system ATP-binding protein